MTSTGAEYEEFETDEESEGTCDRTKVKIHIPPTSRKNRWSHIEDLDSFFIRIYTYHQKHGFSCILLKGCLDLIKVIFTLTFLIFLLYFVDYQILFHNKLPPNFNTTDKLQNKITIHDVIRPFEESIDSIQPFAWMCVVLVLIYWLFRFIKLTYNLYQFWDIRCFFKISLQIPDDELDNVTWHQVQKRICEVQQEQQMCIRKNNITELDIYHRVLRSKNYMVAMINKSLLPMHYDIPFIGSVAYFSQGMKYNIELLLFSDTWGFFQDWNLKEDYKRINKRLELAAKLQTTITWFAIVNLLLGIFIFFWQLVYFVFNYTEILKREPGTLGLRCWSLYGRYYLRHFNELDHELDARLRRAHRNASKYASNFSSPLLAILAQNFTFVSGGMLAVLVLLTIYDEDVLQVEHVLTIMTGLGAIVAVSRAFIPDENAYWCPETLMIEILADVHYLPDSWRGNAHKSSVRNEFSKFFQYKATNLFYELVSPLVTPFIFFFKLRPRSLEIIDFYRNFTVAVLGVGDVCSFSLMDMRKHGNVLWQPNAVKTSVHSNKQTQAEDGKTELSLVHFAAMNPTWQPPEEASAFLEEVKEQATRPDNFVGNDAHDEALMTVSSEFSMMVPKKSFSCKSSFSRTTRTEGPTRSFSARPMNEALNSILYNHGDSEIHPGLLIQANNPAVDASINTLYLHSLHHRRIRRPVDNELLTFDEPTTSSSPSRALRMFSRASSEHEKIPLLHKVHLKE